MVHTRSSDKTNYKMGTGLWKLAGKLAMSLIYWSYWSKKYLILSNSIIIKSYFCLSLILCVCEVYQFVSNTLLVFKSYRESWIIEASPVSWWPTSFTVSFNFHSLIFVSYIFCIIIPIIDKIFPPPGIFPNALLFSINMRFLFIWQLFNIVQWTEWNTIQLTTKYLFYSLIKSQTQYTNY